MRVWGLRLREKGVKGLGSRVWRFYGVQRVRIYEQGTYFGFGSVWVCVVAVDRASFAKVGECVRRGFAPDKEHWRVLLNLETKS